jgi:hypothetical protein
MILEKRVEALERTLGARDGQRYTVYFKDGTSRLIHPGEVLQMAFEDNGQIDHFEEGEFCGNEGCLEGLANVLIGGG